MKKVGIGEAKATFSALINRVLSGESFVITKRGIPVALISPMPSSTPRLFGIARDLFKSGKIRVSADFDAPLPGQMLTKLYAAE